MTNARLEELRAKFRENPRRFFAPFANELRKTGDAAQAISICRHHLSGQPGHVSGHIVLAQALHEAGEDAEAREVFTAALELDPENLIALRTMGDIDYGNGEFTGARLWYERLLDADPRNQEIAQLLSDLTAVATSGESSAASFTPTKESDPAMASDDAWRPPPVVHFGESPVPDAPVEAESIDVISEMEPPAVSGFEPRGEEEMEPPAVSGFGPHDEEEIDASGFAATEIPNDYLSAALPQAGSFVDPFAPTESAATPPLTDFEDTFLSPPSSPVIDAAPMEVAPAAGDGELTSLNWTWQAGAESQAVDAEPPAYSAAPMGEERGLDRESRDLSEPPANEATASVELSLPEQAEPPAPYQSVEASGVDALEVGVSESTLPGEPEPVEMAEPLTAQPFAAEEEEAGESPDAPQATEAAEQTSEPEALVQSEESSTTAFQTGESWEEGDEGSQRARFAENGFEGLADDQVGWQAPAAAFSDPEAAPEDWFGDAPEPAVEAPIESSHEVALGAESGDNADDALTTSASSVDESDDWFEAVPMATSEAGEPHGKSEDLFMAPALSPVVSATGDVLGVPDSPELPPKAADAGDVRDEVPAMETLSGQMTDELATAESHSGDATGTGASDASAEDSDERTEWTSSEPETVVVPEPVAELPAPQGVAEPAVGFAPRSDDDVKSGGVSPAPFVTETLAELYLQQGFRDEALAIYRQLSDRDPDNAALREKLMAVELGSSVSEAAAPAVAPHSESRSVRSFFGSLARRTPSAAAVQARLARSAESGAAEGRVLETIVEGATSVPEASSQEPPFAAAASALANLFAASRPAASDERAATALAGALAEPSPGGRPSRAAERELSLDHLFRDVPGGGSGSAVDELYAPPNAPAGQAARPDEAAGAPDEGETDIRQFTAWLEGLRKK